MENFQRITHKRAIKLWDSNPEVVEGFIKYLQRNMVPGTGMRAVRWHRLPLGIGKHLSTKDLKTSISVSHEVERLAAEIIQKESAVLTQDDLQQEDQDLQALVDEMLESGVDFSGVPEEDVEVSGEDVDVPLELLEDADLAEDSADDPEVLEVPEVSEISEAVENSTPAQ